MNHNVDIRYATLGEGVTTQRFRTTGLIGQVQPICHDRKVKCQENNVTDSSEARGKRLKAWCLSYPSIAVIKHHEQSSLPKKALNRAYGLKGFESVVAEQRNS